MITNNMLFKTAELSISFFLNPLLILDGLTTNFSLCQIISFIHQHKPGIFIKTPRQHLSTFTRHVPWNSVPPIKCTTPCSASHFFSAFLRGIYSSLTTDDFLFKTSIKNNSMLSTILMKIITRTTQAYQHTS